VQTALKTIWKSVELLRKSVKQNPNEVLELTKKEKNSGDVSTGAGVQFNSPPKSPKGGKFNSNLAFHCMKLI